MPEQTFSLTFTESSAADTSIELYNSGSWGGSETFLLLT